MYTKTIALQLVRTVVASPERVFEAWTTAQHVERWACPDPGALVTADLDLRVGGHYSIRMEVEGGPFTAFGTYHEVDPPRRLVYTWDWKEDPHAMHTESLVTVEFVPVDGGTEIRLTHQGFPAPSDMEGHEVGWRMCLDRLVAQVDS